MSRAGWFRGEVEGFEVEEVGFDFGAEGDGVAEFFEDRDDFGHGFDEGVLGAEGMGGAGEGQVEGGLITRFPTGYGSEG